MDCVGIFTGESFSLLEGVCFDHDEAACLIGERTCEHDATLRIERFHPREMCGTVNLAFGLPIRSVKPEDDKLHETSLSGVNASTSIREPKDGIMLSSRERDEERRL